MVPERNVSIIKRSGQECFFDGKKIVRSIIRANMDVAPDKQMPEGRINLIADEVRDYCIAIKRPLPTSEIRDKVESSLITLGSPELARQYIRKGASKK